MELNSDWRDILAGLRGDEPVEPDPTSETAPQPRQSGVLDIILDKKRRGGKLSTIVAGFTLDPEQVDGIAADLRRSLATGGSARGGEILLQGDCRQAALKALQKMGMKARII